MSLSVRRRLMMGTLDHPEDGKYCWVLTGNGVSRTTVWRSTDYGASFVSMQANNNLLGAVSVAVDYTGSAKCISSDGLGFVNLKGSTSPSQTFGAGGHGKSLCCGSAVNRSFWGVNTGTDWSTGYGVNIYYQNGLNGTATKRGTLSTWDRVGDDTGACSSNANYILIGGAEGYTNAIYSNDGGLSWGECLATQSFGNGTRAVAVSGTGRTALTTTSTGWNRSYDYLATWVQGNAATTWWGVAISGNDGYGQGVAYLTNSNKGLWRGPISSTGTITWTKILDNANIKFLKTNFYGTRLLGVSFDGAVYYSNNGGYPWTASTGITAGANILSIGMNRNPN